MSISRVVFLLVSIALSFVATRALTQEAKSGGNAESKLVGTWQLVSTKRDGKEGKLPQGATVVKHITPTHFMSAMYDEEGKVRVATGGRYTLNGQDYEETA